MLKRDVYGAVILKWFRMVGHTLAATCTNAHKTASMVNLKVIG